jgi:hypothetical protein
VIYSTLLSGLQRLSLFRKPSKIIYVGDIGSRNLLSSVYFYDTARRNIPECCHCHIRRCENVKSHLHHRHNDGGNGNL